MEGDIESDELKGIIPRSIDALFDSVGIVVFECRSSLIDVY
jgi:hypothetical protein